MGTIDIILLLCFIPALVQGISKGFVGQVVALASVVIGAYLAFHFSTAVGEWLTEYIQADARLVNIISFAIILIVVIIVLNLLGNLISRLLKLVMLGWLNKLLGICVAVFNTVLILGLIISVFDGINANWHIVRPEMLDASILYNGIRNICRQIFPFLQGLISNV
ncbi:MAG: CvpA family protein [Bacteroidales bacterium]|nr:CvpA family protein [Bacteroidales bacterium]